MFLSLQGISGGAHLSYFVFINYYLINKKLEGRGQTTHLSTVVSGDVAG
jgi:hypothetical protein